MFMWFVGPLKNQGLKAKLKANRIKGQTLRLRRLPRLRATADAGGSVTLACMRGRESGECVKSVNRIARRLRTLESLLLGRMQKS